MAYAQVTLAISDGCSGGLEGFAPLSDQLPASTFADAVEDGEPMSLSGACHAVFVDLMDDDDTQVGEKCISVTQAAEILGVPTESVVQLGRQRLAQINDDDAAHVAAGRKAVAL